MVFSVGIKLCNSGLLILLRVLLGTAMLPNEFQMLQDEIQGYIDEFGGVSEQNE